MRSSFFTGILLTLFMLLLVSLAAFLFLFQGRQAIEEQATRVAVEASELRSDLTQTESELAVSDATREAMADDLAALEADTVLLEGELVESQQRVDALTEQSDSLSDELATANETITRLENAQASASQQPPNVEIIAPEDGTVFAPDALVELIVAASDVVGIAAVNLTVNGSTLNSYAADGEALVTFHDTWAPATAGDHTISAIASNNNGLSSEPVTVTVQVIDFETRNRATLAQIESNVAELRGIEPPEPVELTFVPQQELQEQASNFQLQVRPADLDAETLTLAAFDFVGRSFDLGEALTMLQAAYGPTRHSPEPSALIAVNQDGGMDAQVLWNYLHNFAHVLQDKQYSLDSLASDAGDSEALKAVNALVEGEAELIGALYLEDGDFTAEQIAEIEESFGDAGADLPVDFPLVLVNEWLFPRTAGLEFVRELYQQGQDSFTLIDAAWSDPPQSSEHILHPDRYLGGDAPEPVTLAVITDTLGEGWELVDEDTLGEFTLRQYLRQRIDEDLTDTAATGWGGDRYAVYWNEAEENLVLVLRIVWDTVPDSAEFSAIFPTYPTRLFSVSGQIQPTGEECWQGADVICFSGADDAAIIVRAPDMETAVAVIQSLESEG